MNKPLSFLLLAVLLTGSSARLLAADYQLFARSNLVAWCIVPFDAKKRGPAERAEMVKQLGIPAIAYDWRAEHVPQFEQEILEYQKRGLGYFAFWGSHEDAYQALRETQTPPANLGDDRDQSQHAHAGGQRVNLAAESELLQTRPARGPSWARQYGALQPRRLGR